MHILPTLLLWECSLRCIGVVAGLPPPNFPMPGPFWPQMPNHMGQAPSQGSRQGPFNGSESSGNFDALSAAYYSPFGAQQMAAAMAAAAVSILPHM